MPSGRKKPPPDYFSRRVQFRLLIAVASLLLVISLMFEARKAENWQWMWNGAPQIAGEVEEIDTSLPAADSSDPPGTVYANSDGGPAVVIQQASSDEQRDALRRLELDAWKRILGRLERSERRSLDQLLLAARSGDPGAVAVEPSTSELVAKLSQTYAAYLNDANEAVMLSGESLEDTQKASLIKALNEMERGWQNELLPALAAPVESRTWTEVDRVRLGTLQSLLDDLAVKAIRDDSFWRPAEQDAWFRWFEMLQRTDPAELERQSTGQVGFLQLFKQSDEYRGKLVTIHGSARLAYRVPAPNNILGITDYVVYWIKPTSGPNSPIVVYALETPPGFPEVGEKDLDGGTSLNEEVTFTGFFFKRWAYPGQSGLQTAPLLVARGPAWTPDATRGQERALPGWKVAVAAVAAMLFLSIGLAVLAYRSAQAPAGATTSGRTANSDQLEALKNQPVLPSPEEALRQLSATEKEDARD